MTAQLPLALDGVPAPIPRARTQTSYEAAIAQVPKRQQRKAGALWLYRQAGQGGLTDYELAEAMGIYPFSPQCRSGRRWLTLGTWSGTGESSDETTMETTARCGGPGE